MSGKPLPARGAKFLSWAAGAAILVFSGAQGWAQTTPAPVATPAAAVSGGIETGAASDKTAEGGGYLVQTGCSSCGGGGLAAPSYDGGCAGCGGGGCRSCCYAGRQPCDCCWDGTTKLGRCCATIYECLCCPDPCYEPVWLPVANMAFFQDHARPITHMRLRYDGAFGLSNPDRGEFYQARARTTPNQVSATGGAAGGPGKGPAFIGSHFNFNDVTMYNEAAVGGFGMFVEFLYRNVEATPSPIDPIGATGNASGFGDMNLGTKSLLVDSELFQFTFQFKTFLPMGNFLRGLGTGHVSLEPAFLSSLKCTNTCYMQMEWALWIPVGGDNFYQSNVFHQHYSINKILCEKCKGCQVVGSFEVNHWAICNGAYTNPDFLVGGNPTALSADSSIVSVGPGIRIFLCDKYDIGVGSAFAVTNPHWGAQQARAEFRWRF